MTLTSRAELSLHALPDYLDNIIDRLASYQPKVEREPGSVAFIYPFGRAILEHSSTRLVMTGQAPDRTGLARIKDLMAVAVELYAKAEQPRIVWTGDLAGDNKVEQFRLMHVAGKNFVTPRMLRVRLEGEDLHRFTMFGGMHIRMLFATADNPAPAWPVLGDNGLPTYPTEGQRPISRAYTIRRLHVATGWMEVDFLMHADHGIASSWAQNCQPGDVIGVLGPVGRPLRSASRFIIGADETGLPAVGRMLETMEPSTQGKIYVEVENKDEIQDLHAPSFQVEWLVRDHSKPECLAEVIQAEPWTDDVDTFGWFAAETSLARTVRENWRSARGLGRDSTLAAGYWQRGRTGFMAG
ncbi:siderophore-interacting protein [Tianweitania populi]|uniref:Siderophore-interacting protein n=1 Tax=Tianweitania populi TaxID=1607949 RepID=A0A8J3DZT8_9HYPH|nr:siderophore-interacting protein [Tianweitania populi]GHD19266.1 siderophore-interacting protein [Tianweitania populi]